MNAIQVRKRIESETLHLPELREMIGRTVQIIILDEGGCVETPLETHDTFFSHKPERSLSTEEREKDQQRLDELAKTNPGLAAALTIAAAGGPDVDAIISQRARG
jgi:hypothetical protein